MRNNVNDLTTKEKIIALNLLANIFRGINEIRYDFLNNTPEFFPSLRKLRLKALERRNKIFKIINQSTISLLDHMNKT